LGGRWKQQGHADDKKMKRAKMKVYFFLFVLLFSLSSNLYSDAGTSCFNFLAIPVNSRAAVNPLENGPVAVFANPALIDTSKTELEFSYASWYDSLDLMSAGFGQRLSQKFSLGIYATLMNLSEPLSAYDKDGIPSGKAEYSNYRYSAGFSYSPVDILKLGLSFTAAGEVLDNDTKSALLGGAGMELKFSHGLLHSLSGLFFNPSYPADTRLDIWANGLGGQVVYGTEKLSPLSTYAVFLKENTANAAVSIGLLSSDTSDIYFGVEYRLENIVFNTGLLMEADSDMGISAGLTFLFNPLKVDLSYVSRGDLGNSIFSTVGYAFDMSGFVDNSAQKREVKKKKKREYVKIGSISELNVIVDDNGAKEIWLNFTSSRKLEGDVIISRNKRLVARAVITDVLSEKPFLYEAMIKAGYMKEQPAEGDVVAVSKAKIKSPKATSHKKTKKKEEKLESGKSKVNLAIAAVTPKGVSAADASIVQDFLYTEFHKIKTVNLVDRQNMETILTEQNFQQTGCTTVDCIITMGKILNVQKMIVSRVYKKGTVHMLAIKVINIETGKVELSDNQKWKDKKGREFESLETAVGELTKRILNSLNLD